MLDSLEQELSDMIIEACRVTDPDTEAITPDAPLIGPDSPYGLDSLDAVEIVVALQKKYQIRIEAQETGREALTSLSSLANFVRRQSKRVP